MGYSLQFGWLYEALGAIASGAAMTVFLIAVTTVLGTVISIAGAAARRSRYRLLRQAITAYVELVRNTPFLVQLFFIFFGLPSLGIRLDPIVAAILAMTLNMAAYTTEIVGAGLDAVPRGPARGGAGARAAAAAGVHQDRAAAGAEGDLPGADQPDRHHDAGIGGRLADRGARTHL